MGTKDHSQRTHSECGGSNAPIWVNCQGSIMLSRKLPKAPPNKYMLRGTKLHEWEEILVDKFLQHKMDGTDPDSGTEEIAAQMGDKDYEALLSVRQLVWEKVFEESVTGKFYGQEEHYIFHAPTSSAGTVDLWVIYYDDKGKRAGVVVDYKFGGSRVEVKKNEQLGFYASCLRRFVRNGGKDLDYVRGVIIQPADPYGEVYKEWIWTNKALDVFEKKAEKALHNLYVREKPAYKVGSHCKYCPAQACCPKYQGEASKRTSLDLVKLDQLKMPDFPTVPDEQVARLVLHKEMLQEIIKAADKYAIMRYMNGNPLPGTKVALTNGRRGWIKDEDKVVKALVSLNLTPDDIFKPKLQGITAIEGKLKGQKGVLEKLALTEKSAGRPIIVSADDERPPAPTDLLTLESTED